MKSIRTHVRSLVIAVAAISSLAVIPAAQAYQGDWYIQGSFERTTTPSFFGGFNPNDVDFVSASYDNRAKTLTLRLANFEVPSRDPVYISFGNASNGICVTGGLDVTITSRDITTTRLVSGTERYWIPAQELWAAYYPGPEWAYVGYNPSSNQYLWRRPGGWGYRDVTQNVVVVDPTSYERVATLHRAGIDGSLSSSAVVSLNALSATWTLSSLMLNNLSASCAEVKIPSRQLAYPWFPGWYAPPVTDPVPDPGTDPNADPGAPEVTLDDIEATATRRGSKILVKIVGGEDADATEMGLRIKRSSKTLDFHPKVLVKNSTARYISVRFSDGVDWSDWQRIAVQ